MATKSHLLFELNVGPLSESEAAVRHFRGVEELSRPFSFQIDFVLESTLPVALDSLLLGAPTCLSIHRPSGEKRFVNGICTRAQQTGLAMDRPTYRIVVEPKLALLGLKQSCRIFQEKTAVEIVKTILGEHGVSFMDVLRATYPKREMCIQYRETDLAFVSRLLEEEGITFWFEHTREDHVMFLGDCSEVFPSLPGGEHLPFRIHSAAVLDEEHVSALKLLRAVRPGKATLRGFDFQRPLFDVTAASSSGAGAEVYDFPPRAFEAADVKRLSQLELEAQRMESRTWRCRSTSVRLAPGFVLETEPPGPSLGVRLVTLRITHAGHQEEDAGEVLQIADKYQNDFTAMDVTGQFRPERRTERPIIIGPQTATVVGPSSEEIYPDPFGRVKVQFHWDRQGKRDEKSSAWVRLARSWSGAGFGAVLVPRIGQEVLVRFLDGNPDRPLVSGAIYNGNNRSPVQLPQDKTQSTLKTDSSPHNDGFNELRFEDAAEAEKIVLHGQKDEQIRVENHKNQKIGGSEALKVAKDRTLTVNGDQSLKVEQDEESDIGGKSTLEVTWDRRVTTQGNHVESVHGNASLQVDGFCVETIAGRSEQVIAAKSELEVLGLYGVSTGADSRETVVGDKTVKVDLDLFQRVGEMGQAYADGDNAASRRQEFVTGSDQVTVGGSSTCDVSGHATASADQDWTEQVGGSTEIDVPSNPAVWQGKKFTLEADKLSIVVGGKVALSMEKSGKIEIAGQEIRMGPFTGSGVPMNITGPGAAQGKKASVDEAAELALAMDVAEISLVDQDGIPVAGEPFKVEFADGSVKFGTTDSEGRGRVPAPKPGSYKVTFTRLQAEAWSSK